MSSDEVSLVVRAREGDVEAFSALVESHWQRLVRFARSVVGDGEAEDAAQDGLVIAWKKLGGLREPAAFASWLMRIVARLCVDRAKRRRRVVPLGEAGDCVATGTPGQTAPFEVERMLAQLAPRQRAVMHLTVIEGLTDSEIGGLLAITAGSVRAHRRRARTRLRQVLGVGEVVAAGPSARAQEELQVDCGSPTRRTQGGSR